MPPDPPNENVELSRLGHRHFVGGRWDEIGTLQFDFLVAQGLRPEHVLLDIGCGALRGGLHFIRYLSPGNYLGLDKHHELIEAGISELGEGVLEERKPEFVVADNFAFGRFSKPADYAIAQSVFTHLTLRDVRRCLRRLSKASPGCRLYATYFEGSRRNNPPESNSRLVFRYSRSNLERIAEQTGWRCSFIGDWGHPRDQQMVLLRGA